MSLEFKLRLEVAVVPFVVVGPDVFDLVRMLQFSIYVFGKGALLSNLPIKPRGHPGEKVPNVAAVSICESVSVDAVEPFWFASPATVLNAA